MDTFASLSTHSNKRPAIRGENTDSGSGPEDESDWGGPPSEPTSEDSMIQYTDLDASPPPPAKRARTAQNGGADGSDGVVKHQDEETNILHVLFGGNNPQCCSVEVLRKLLQLVTIVNDVAKLEFHNTKEFSGLTIEQYRESDKNVMVSAALNNPAFISDGNSFSVSSLLKLASLDICLAMVKPNHTLEITKKLNSACLDLKWTDGSSLTPSTKTSTASLRETTSLGEEIKDLDLPPADLMIRLNANELKELFTATGKMPADSLLTINIYRPRRVSGGPRLICWSWVVATGEIVLNHTYYTLERLSNPDKNPEKLAAMTAQQRLDRLERYKYRIRVDHVNAEPYSTGQPTELALMWSQSFAIEALSPLVSKMSLLNPIIKVGLSIPTDQHRNRLFSWDDTPTEDQRNGNIPLQLKTSADEPIDEHSMRRVCKVRMYLAGRVKQT